MMSLPTKKTEKADFVVLSHADSDHLIALGSLATVYGDVTYLSGKAAIGKPPPPKTSADDISHQEQEAIMSRRVTVEEAAKVVGVCKRKMWDLIHPEVNAVVNGYRPGTKRRWVDLDSVDELYRSDERMRKAEELTRRLRKKRIAATNERKKRKNGSG